GPCDADESSGATKIFKDLALGFAARGVATLRYVKRTRVDPRGVVTLKEEVLDAVREAIVLARATPEIDPHRVVVIGHSQGGYLAPRIADQTPELAGVAVLGGPTRPLEDKLLDQLTYFHLLEPSASLAKKIEEARAFKERVNDPALAAEDELVIPAVGG